MKETKIFGLSAGDELTDKICKYLGVRRSDCVVKHFADGETNVSLGETVRGCKVFVVQSTCNPVDRNLMELLQFVDVCKRCSADEITCVIPYFGYSRQDRMNGREALSSKIVANCLKAVGADRVVVLDLHASQIQGFFDIPVDAMSAMPVISKHIKDLNIENLVVVSPDHGGVKRARTVAETVNAPLAVVDKRRPKANVAEATFIIGDVKDKNVCIVDDICDTGGSLIAASKILKEHGAKDIYVAVTHGVLSLDAVEKIDSSIIKKMFVTNTIPLSKKSSKIEVIDVSGILAEFIKAIDIGSSVSEVYDKFM